MGWALSGNLFESGVVAGRWSATFTSQFADLTATEVIDQIEDENGRLHPQLVLGHRVVVDAADDDVPEPASLALMGLALSSMAVAIRRRRPRRVDAESAARTRYRRGAEGHGAEGHSFAPCVRVSRLRASLSWGRPGATRSALAW